jgi:hypothetical protein
MRTVLCILCVAMCSRIAVAQEGVSNFDACVSEAKQRHTDATMEAYFSYKCDGVIAQRLAARPDQCGADVRPSRTRIQRSSRQLEDGLYLRMIWRTGVCAGMCETRFYSDARETRYLCEVRRHIVGRDVPDGGARQYPSGRRDHDECLSEGSVYRRLTGDERMGCLGRPRETARGSGRWVYGEPRRYLPYKYGPRDDFPDGDRRGDGSSTDEYRRYDPYRRGDP